MVTWIRWSPPVIRVGVAIVTSETRVARVGPTPPWQRVRRCHGNQAEENRCCCIHYYLGLSFPSVSPNFWLQSVLRTNSEVGPFYTAPSGSGTWIPSQKNTLWTPICCHRNRCGESRGVFEGGSVDVTQSRGRSCHRVNSEGQVSRTVVDSGQPGRSPYSLHEPTTRLYISVPTFQTQPSRRTMSRGVWKSTLSP